MTTAFLGRFPVCLGEGSLYERLRRGNASSFDPDIAHAGMLYDDEGRALLAATHREYIDVARAAGIPIVAGSPTWRASAARIARSAHSGKPINADAFAFMRELTDGYDPGGSPILNAAVTGPAGDGYDPSDAPNRENAMLFHAHQIDELASCAFDLFKVQTLPSVEEARGIAALLAETGLPYVLSFVVRPDGRVMDGTPLADAVNRIDDETSRPPANYAINCVHASVFANAIAAVTSQNAAAGARITGIDANTSAKTPEELDGLEDLETEDPEDFGTALAALHVNGITYLGGCCGTSTAHIAELALRLPAAAV